MNKTYILAVILSLGTISFGQETGRIVFYNVENLFDTLDHPKKNDNEFLPEAKRNWSSDRYWRKIERINSVFDSLCRPEIIGLCEIENRQVVQDLVDGGFMKGKWNVVHHESLDQRGIDNAIVYNKNSFTEIDNGILRFDMPPPNSPSRDIVWAKFLTHSNDTFFVMVNHWPSRRGGAEASEPKRMVASNAAVKFIDSLKTHTPKSGIVFMGDLNDYPENKAPSQISERLTPMITEKSGKFGGTHNYRGHWGVLDHILVSKNLLKGKSMRILKKSGEIHSNDFLLTTYKGNIVPKRNYGGLKYLDGYSDHLPVSIRFRMKNKN